MLFILDMFLSEMLAKAKRLARFKVELSKSEQNSSDVTDQKASANRHTQSILEQKHVGGHSVELTRNFTNGHNFSDYEGTETSSIIIGLCPDMCPGIYHILNLSKLVITVIFPFYPKFISCYI